MSQLLKIIAFVLLLPVAAAAQITVPNTFAPGDTIYSSLVNANFTAIGSDALNRTGGTITGNVTVSSGVTIDGIDISAFLPQSVATSATPTFASLILTGGLISNGVGIINSSGQIPSISTTYFASVDGTNLTGVAKLASANTYSAINKFKTYSETKTAPTIGGGALTLDLSAGTQFAVALNGNATITITNPVSSGEGGSFTILFTNDGTLRTLTWPGSVLWSAGSAYVPTSTNNKVDVVQCIYNNGGSTYYCNYVTNF